MGTGSVLARRLRGLAIASGLGLGLAVFGATELSDVLAQEDDVTVGSEASFAGGAATAEIEALVASILAGVFGEAGVAGDGLAVEEGSTSGGDLNVGGNMGGSVVMGGGTGGDISIGEASGGITIGGTESGG